MIKPIPSKFGYGFCSVKELEFEGYKKEKINDNMYNYYYTKDNCLYPKDVSNCLSYTIDAFSPNLNKNLHVGHLRQLCYAKFLYNTLGKNAKFVSLLGASLGIIEGSEEKLQEWFDFIDFKSEIYYDVKLPENKNDFKSYIESDPNSEYRNCEVYSGIKNPVVIKRENGKKTYAYYELIFKNLVNPTHYVTGVEQHDHFYNLGLGEKHIGLGLVLDKDNKKMKSRSGEALSAIELLDQIIEHLNKQKVLDYNISKKLAWNILVCNFLGAKKNKDVKYNLNNWTNPDSSGMYISYTYARIKNALEKINDKDIFDKSLKELNLTNTDVELIGMSEYYKYYLQNSIDTLEPSYLITFLCDLAKKLNECYHKENISNGRIEFQYSVFYASKIFEKIMTSVGMFKIDKI